jgi:hypothetical protein
MFFIIKSTAMEQISYPPSEHGDQILCGYVNASNSIQIIRITSIPKSYFERVVFPGQRLWFKALPDAYLEIHTNTMVSGILSDRIRCNCLQINEVD